MNLKNEEKAKNELEIKNFSKIKEFYRFYCITSILKISINEETAFNLVKSILTNLEDICSIEDLKNSGKKKFTYPIEKQENGIYITTIIKVKDDNDLNKNLNEISRKLKGIPEILRFTIIRCINNIENNPGESLFHMKTYMDKNNFEKEKK